MTDKEVGELWGKAKLPVVFQLIRKLVEERALAHYDHGELKESYCPYDEVELLFLELACQDFGIPWKEYMNYE